MSEIGSIDKVAVKSPLVRLGSKTHVSMETPHQIEAAQAKDATQDIRKLEFEMEQADHAFALMMEIRQKIEKQYQELSATQPE